MKSNLASPAPMRDARLCDAQIEAINQSQTIHNETPNVSVCICTYQRPGWLRQTLDSVRANPEPAESIEVIVVDNDPAASAAETVANFQLSNGISAQYYHETTRSISAARNKALKEAKGKWIAFIDDDELATENWLENLLIAADQHNADVVFGPVIPLYDRLTPAWIVTGAYFDRKRLSTGTKVSWHDARTGNALIKRESVPNLETSFSDKFGLTGGGDTVFFRGLEQIGVNMIWCDEAVVYEHVPLARCTPKWLLARAFRLGQTWARVELIFCDGSRLIKTASIILASLLRITATLPLAILSAPFSVSKSFSHARVIANRAGKISALFGYRYNEY